MSYVNRSGAEGTRQALLASNPDGDRGQLERSLAHNFSSCGSNLAHAQRHNDMVRNGEDPAFNGKHVSNHLDLLSEDLEKGIGHLREYSPGVAAELDALAAATPDTSGAETPDTTALEPA